jgi:hypothetical protein
MDERLGAVRSANWAVTLKLLVTLVSVRGFVVEASLQSTKW